VAQSDAAPAKAAAPARKRQRPKAGLWLTKARPPQTRNVPPKSGRDTRSNPPLTQKAGGSSGNGRDSDGRRLGVKMFGGQAAIRAISSCASGGTKWLAGRGVGIGRDHTIFGDIRRQGDVPARGSRAVPSFRSCALASSRRIKAVLQVNHQGTGGKSGPFAFPAVSASAGRRGLDFVPHCLHISRHAGHVTQEPDQTS